MILQLEEGIVQISVENPDQFNALSSVLIQELEKDFQKACGDFSNRVIILRGSPVGKYCAPLAGADLSGLVDQSDPENWKPLSRASAREHMEEGIEAIYQIRVKCRRDGDFQNCGELAGRVVVIGLVDGPCLAGGIEFMLGLSDLVYATPRSTFGMREILLGGIGGWGGPEVLRRRLGSQLWVNEMLLAAGNEKSGDIRATTACRRGLINDLASEDIIEEHVIQIAKRIAKLDRMAVGFNLAATEHNLCESNIPTVTSYMVELMQKPAWVNSLKSFLTKGQ